MFLHLSIFRRHSPWDPVLIACGKEQVKSESALIKTSTFKGQVQGLGWFLTRFPSKFAENNHVDENIIFCRTESLAMTLKIMCTYAHYVTLGSRCKMASNNRVTDLVKIPVRISKDEAPTPLSVVTYWSLLYSAVLRCWADSLRSHVILHDEVMLNVLRCQLTY